MNEIFTDKYRIIHEIKEPSRVTDYDYDTDPYRRFISTYIHSLKFFDKITDEETLSLGFTSETCANIVTALVQAMTVGYSMTRPNMLMIKGVFIDGEIHPGVLGISINIDGSLMLSFAHVNDKIRITLLPNEIEEFYNLMDSDELGDMYAISSDGGW